MTSDDQLDHERRERQRAFERSQRIDRVGWVIAAVIVVGGFALVTPSSWWLWLVVAIAAWCLLGFLLQLGSEDSLGRRALFAPLAPLGFLRFAPLLLPGNDAWTTRRIQTQLGRIAAENVRANNVVDGNVTIAGSPTTNFSTMESVTINGQGTAAGDTLTVTTLVGADQVTLTPGAAFDAGTVTITTTGAPITASAPPLTFLGLGTAAGSGVVFADGGGGRTDTLIYNGTAASDTFGVSATAVVTLNSQVAVTIPGILALRLLGQDGDDTFNVTGSVAGGNAKTQANLADPDVLVQVTSPPASSAQPVPNGTKCEASLKIKPDKPTPKGIKPGSHTSRVKSAPCSRSSSTARRSRAEASPRPRASGWVFTPPTPPIRTDLPAAPSRTSTPA